MVEFNPQGRPRGTDTEDRDDTIRRPYNKVEPDSAGRTTAAIGGSNEPYVAPGHLPERLGRETRETRDSRSLVDLLRELMNEAQAMFRQELALAKAEISQNVKSMARHAAMTAVGGAVAYAGLLTIIGALALGAFVLLTWAGLDSAISLWLGPLLVGVIVAIVGYAMLKSGMNRLQNDDVIPNKTAQSMRENAEWMQERIK